MDKAKEISALWEQIKPQIDEMVHLCYEVESHAEVTADAYQRGYEEGYKDRYNEPGKGKIQVGDEVKNTQTDARFIVTHMWVNNHGEKGVSGFNYECSAFSTALDLVRKTGRHFPEIAEVLRKMKESDNG